MQSRDVTSRPITIAPHIPFRILTSLFRMPQFRILPIAAKRACGAGVTKSFFVSMRTSCSEHRMSCSGRQDKRIMWSVRIMNWKYSQGCELRKQVFFQYRSRPAVVSNEVDVVLVKVACSASCCVGKCDGLDKNLKMSLNIIHILMSNRHISEMALYNFI